LAGLEANFYQGNSLVADAALDPLAFDWQTHFSHIFSLDNAINNIAVKALNIRATGQNEGIEVSFSENSVRVELNPVRAEPVEALQPFDKLRANGDGGFDVILGNPPYVRQELFTNLKPYLQQHYSAYHGVADLYVYFYELGLNKLLATGGRLGFISSSSFFKTSSGEPLRRLLRQHGQIETLVDFGDWQVFEGVTTYPAIVVLQKVAADDAVPASFLQLTAAVPDLAATFETTKQTLNLAQLSGGDGTEIGEASEWQLEGIEASALRDKLTHGHPSLKQAVGSPLYGIKTGLNEAFVIDRATRDKLVYADPASEPLFKPFLEGKDIKRWQVESEDRWLILMPKGWTKSLVNMPVAKVNTTSTATEIIAESTAFDWLKTRHPHLAAYLSPFADAARRRTDQGYYWWELRACDYYEKFAKPKIFWPEFSLVPNFSVDETDLLSTNKAFFINADSPHFVCGVLNSKAVWFVVQGITSIIRGGFQQLRAQNIETLPIPAATEAQQTELSHLSTACAQAAKARLTAQRDFGRRILDLLPTPAPKGAQLSLGEKLSSWWQLKDFKAFQFEVQKRFKTDIPLRERNEWEALFAEQKSRVHQLSANIAATERSIDAIVYTLFGLNATEIALVERAVAR
jgi:TaqI-like C-terminal specificity domain/Eco57I restriction-modification methylase